MAEIQHYSAKDIKQLDQRMHVRHRVGMYLGGSSDDGLTTGLREYADNSFDEILNGHGSEVTVTFYPDGSAEVADNGRGLPVDKNDAGVNGIILTVGTIASGNKFGGKNITGGLNGVGASAFVACSSRTDVTVYRDNKKHQISFKEGLPGFFAKEGDPTSNFTDSIELKVSKDDRSATERKKNPTGTVIRSWPDYSVFLPGSKFLIDELKFRFKSTAFLIPGARITVIDHHNANAEPVTEIYDFDGGLVDMLPTLTNHGFVSKPLHLVTQGTFTETRNVLQEDNTTARMEVERPVDIDVAFAYTNQEETILRSYVNIINTKNGGTHESGLWRALSRVLINYIKSTRGILKAKEETPIIDDVRDGFAGVISVKFPEPTFTGQEKSTLSTPQMTALVSQAVGTELQKWLDNKKNAAQAKILAQKIVEASRIRLAAKQQKDVARRKTALQGASMPAKLVDCSEVGTEFTELLICEGDSALGTLKAARDSRYQALLPIRGKILNVQKASLADMLKNAEISDIIQVIGAGAGKSFDIDNMRVSKMIIAADADQDGLHIQVLLVTLAWKLFRPMVEAGKLYVAVPPLFVVKTKGKNGEIFYAEDEQEKDKIVARLAKKNQQVELQRLKGLGEMNAEDFWTTTLNPETRTLRQITIEDATVAEDMLELAMGNKVEPRRDWIMNSRDKIADDMIDA